MTAPHRGYEAACPQGGHSPDAWPPPSQPGIMLPHSLVQPLAPRPRWGRILPPLGTSGELVPLCNPPGRAAGQDGDTHGDQPLMGTSLGAAHPSPVGAQSCPQPGVTPSTNQLQEPVLGRTAGKRHLRNLCQRPAPKWQRAARSWLFPILNQLEAFGEGSPPGAVYPPRVPPPTLGQPGHQESPELHPSAGQT